ncbi:hypothetical protein HAX54_016813 [Datura stramonium]|uniref:Uncharacterized protein n=1 Tax=Datura stramonium TaxID=4076 RepID=A0ABS8ULT6_DATST|nr:hypothetical protein [Datura stramonium]
MFYPGSEMCQKRKRDVNVPLQVVDRVSWQLWIWWNETEKARFENERTQFQALLAQQQEEFDKERAQYATERNQLMIDRAIIWNQLELALNRETSIRQIAITRQQQVLDLEHNYANVKKQVHDLAVDISRTLVYCQGMGYEKFATEVPTFAHRFATKMEDIYHMLGGQPGQEAP